MLTTLRRWLFGPPINELAAIVHNCLWTPLSARVLRSKLRDCGVRLTVAGFYIRMELLEDRHRVVCYDELAPETTERACKDCGCAVKKTKYRKTRMYKRAAIAAPAPE